MKQCPVCGEYTEGRNRCTECGCDFNRKHKSKKKEIKNQKHKNRRREDNSGWDDGPSWRGDYANT